MRTGENTKDGRLASATAQSLDRVALPLVDDPDFDIRRLAFDDFLDRHPVGRILFGIV